MSNPRSWYQLNASLVFAHLSLSNGKPFMAVEAAPPATIDGKTIDMVDDVPTAPVGFALHWLTQVNPNTDGTFGNEGTGTWELVADNTKTTLYQTATGAEYTVGTEAQQGIYDGYGDLPAWLTASAYPGQFYSWVSGAWTLDVAAQLADAQVKQTTTIYTAYGQAITQPVEFTSAGGVTKAFQADANSQTILLQAFTGYSAVGAVPAGFYWVAQDNTQVPFTLADLKGLYAAMLGQGWTAFQNLQTKKAAIAAATTLAKVQAVSW